MRRLSLVLPLATVMAVVASVAPVAGNAQATDDGASDRCEPAARPARPPARPGRPLGSAQADTSCPEDAVPRPVFETITEFPPIPDRWRLVGALGYPTNLLDPYNGFNVLKGDLPIFGEHNDWFFSAILISDTVLEPRRIPTPVGAATTKRPGSIDLIGDGEQFTFNQNLITEVVLYKGNTTFKPPDWEFRFTPVFNYNYTSVEERGALKADPNAGTSRREGFVGVQALFVDKHLRNVSDRYDFDSVRVGIQPFSSDFRGFLFQDSQFGVRLFGTRHNNVFQYNLAWFRRLEKDSNSGLNDITEASFGKSLRDDDVFIANVYWQDFPRRGFFSQGTVIYNRNREKNNLFFEDNGFIQRPASLGTERGRDYDVVYLGYNGDGHFDRWNLSVSGYLALGEETNATFINRESDIRAFFLAAEVSMDFDWIRLRGSFLHASGDDDPYDDTSEGFDAIFENPQFAGADTSFWVRQAVPLIGGGRVSLSNRNGILNSMRSSKEFGQSNFTNPGITLLGVGGDLDIRPDLRVSFNVNQLWFAETEPLRVARNQGNVDSSIGTDLSVSLIYRPFVSQNIVVRFSAAALLPGDGYKDLFGNETPVSVLGNIVFTY